MNTSYNINSTLPLELIDYILNLSADVGSINNPKLNASDDPHLSSQQQLKSLDTKTKRPALNDAKLRLVCKLWKSVIDESIFWKADLKKTTLVSSKAKVLSSSDNPNYKLIWNAEAHLRKLVIQHPDALKKYPFLVSDNQFALSAVSNTDLNILNQLDPKFKSDKDVLIAAIKSVGFQAYNLADETLKKNTDVLIALATWYAYVPMLCPELCKDRDFFLALVKVNGYILKYASDEFKKDKDIVWAAITHRGSALQYADDNFKNTWAYVFAAVTSQGNALAYASLDLKNDPAIVLAAIKNYYEAYNYASQNLKNDDKIRNEYLFQKDKFFFHGD